MRAMKTGTTKVTLNQRLCSFLLSYRTTPHSVTNVPPCVLFLQREVRTRLHLLRVTTEQQVCKKQAEQKWHHDKKARDRECAERETVLSRNYGSDHKWVWGRIGKQCGPVSYHVELPDGRVWRRHIEQLNAVPEPHTFSDCSFVHIPVHTITVEYRVVWLSW